MNLKNISKITYVFAIIALLVWIPACERVSEVIEPTTPQEEIAIGLVLSQTGRHGTSFGEPIQNGLELARNEINASGRIASNLKFIIVDDQSTVDGAIAAYNKLIQEDQVSVILGPATSTATKETFPIARDNEVVAISPTSAASGLSAISDFTFRVALTTGVLVPDGIAATHAKLGYQKVATLYDASDHFSVDGDVALQEALTAKGVEIVATETFQGGDTDFRAQLTQIQALNPDAVFVSSLPPEKPGILRQARELGIAAPLVLRTLTAEDVAAAGEAAEGAITFVGWGTAVDTPGNQAFIENYTAMYGKAPNNYAARSHATLHILAEAIANAESTDAVSIRDALANISNFDTVLGTFSFDENGDAVYNSKILIVKDGKLELFE